MAALINHFRYRPEIDGLRALAVLPVVLYHTGLGFPGGFIGVDVFFVISGFLISSLILRDLEAGKFTFKSFWERRARRILPAMFCMVLVTLIAGWFVLLPGDYAKLGRSTLFQAIFGANIFFWLESGYFAPAAEQMPLLHTWSLAVEEQFYLIVPLLFVGLFRFPIMRTRFALLAFVLLGIAGSLAGSAYGVVHHPSAAFYLLPSRAWELLLGIFVALAPLRSNRAFLRETLCWLGLLLILVPCFAYTKNTPFPGLAAVPPCLGTAMFIWATGQVADLKSSMPSAARILTSRPFVFTGLVSYSFYLVHWPIVAYSMYLAMAPLGLVHRIGLLLLAFGLSVLMWRFVEMPFRKRSLCASRRTLFAFSGGAIVTLLVFGSTVLLAHGFPQRLSPQANRYVSAGVANAFNRPTSITDAENGTFIPLGKPGPGKPTAMVWGDSHAIAAMPAFDAFLAHSGMSGLGAAAYRTAPLLDVNWPERSGINHTAVETFNRAVLSYIQKHSIPEIFLVARWDLYEKALGNKTLGESLITTVKQIVAAGSQPWIVLDPPCYEFNVPNKLALAAMFGLDIASKGEQPGDWNGLTRSGNTLDEIAAAGGRILNLRSALLDRSTNRFLLQMNGESLYSDSDHLSEYGAKTVLIPLLTEKFAGKESSPAPPTPPVLNAGSSQ